MAPTISEEWRVIPDTGGVYEVSNLGQVRSVDHIDSMGRVQKGRVLRCGDNGKGYLHVRLSRRRQDYVHRLVAAAFVENPDGLTEINHIDGDKSNNAAENLEWTSHRANLKHSYDTGLHPVTQKMLDALKLGTYAAAAKVRGDA